jgi:hypothetical protein
MLGFTEILDPQFNKKFIVMQYTTIQFIQKIETIKLNDGTNADSYMYITVGDEKVVFYMPMIYCIKDNMVYFDLSGYSLLDDGTMLFGKMYKYKAGVFSASQGNFAFKMRDNVDTMLNECIEISKNIK